MLKGVLVTFLLLWYNTIMKETQKRKSLIWVHSGWGLEPMIEVGSMAAGKHGAGVRAGSGSGSGSGAWSLELTSLRANMRQRGRDGETIWNPKDQSQWQWHIPYPPNTSITAPPIRNSAFRYMSLWGGAFSFNHPQEGSTLQTENEIMHQLH